MGNYFYGGCSGGQWRNPDSRLQWDTNFKDLLLKDIRTIPARGSKKPCILLAGPIAAGKSSVVNSFLTAGADRIKKKAESGIDDYSLTLKFQRYEGIPNVYRLCDTTGVFDPKEAEIHRNDLLQLMKGHIELPYEFKKISPISEDDAQYVKKPKDEDKSHCLAVVIPSTKVKDMSPNYTDRIKDIIRSARSQDIPAVVILTKIDECCINVMRNPTKVFTCEHIKEVVGITEVKLGLPEGCIFPMMNYASQMQKDTNLDIINLLALKKILEFTSDCMEGPEQEMAKQ